MKKIISLIACFSIAVLAQDAQLQVQKLIKDGVKENKEEIQKMSLSLTSAERETLYRKNRLKGAAGWAALDFSVGFGVGSYIQGDKVFGVTQSIMDGVGWTLMIISFMGMTSIDAYDYDDDGYSRNRHRYNTDVVLFTYLSSLAIIGSSRVMSWIFPFSYQRKYNKALNEALNSNNLSYSIDPLIIPKDKVPAVGLAFNLHY
ncbi:MAG: P13 family porin [Fibromonadales bacterium]|nr:P13 family porin [Fibromonadales bacterium]